MYLSREELEAKIQTLETKVNRLETDKLLLQQDLNVSLLNFNSLSDINLDLQIVVNNSNNVRDYIYENRNDETKTFNDIINLIEALTQ